MKERLWVAVLATTLLAPSAALAAGAKSQQPAPGVPDQVQKSPEEQAQDHYQFGLVYRDKAWKLEEKAAAATNEKERLKLETKAMKQWKKAIQELELATEKNDRFFQAFGSLGYALRKTGDFNTSLKNYDRALQLEPDYPEAIEYRGEAYLGLDRVDEAQEAYIRLFSIDRAQSDTLLAAMKTWVERRRDEGTVEASTLDRVSEWVAEREEIAAQTASVSELRDRGW